MKKIIVLIISFAFSSFLFAQEAEHFTMRFQGYEREYFFHMPDSLNAGRPLVFMLHGHSGIINGPHKRGDDDFPLCDAIWEFFEKYITY